MKSGTPALGDSLILGQRIYTHYPYRRYGEALVIRDGRVVACVSRRAARSLRSRRVRVADFGDAVLTPGLVDSHTHFFYWALHRELVIDVTHEMSLDATLRRIAAEAPRRKIGDWIVSRGFEINVWGTGFPSAADLDLATGEVPAIVRSRDGHCAWLNTAAMRRVGIHAQFPDPPGGRILRDSAGRATGVVQESAVDALPNPIVELAQRTDAAARRVVDRALSSAYREAWSFGFCGVHALDDAASLSHFQRQRSAGTLGFRVVHSIPHAEMSRAIALGLRSGIGDDWLRVGAIKIFSDGTLGSRTALMFDAYPGMADPASRFGVGVVTGEELRDAVVKAARHGWAVWIHAIGDRAAHECVAAIAAARKVESARLPHRIEHAQCVRPADIRAMARLGIITSVQPCHMLSDIPVADRNWPRARKHAFPLRRFFDAGLCVPFGSDVPVEPIDPRRGLFAAVARRDEHGNPSAGWHREQRVTIQQALAGFTEHAARSVGDAAPRGTLLPGAPADVTIWGGDPLQASFDELRELPIRGCAIAGVCHVD
ncbi:MAG: amidohydrolase [Phycisphaerales bacterium]|nr:amidohydrolase [Phycisphaerales bacterium]